MELLASKDAAYQWLTDEQWIVLSFHGGFADHLEQLYFTPGTEKNAEFEILVAPIRIAGLEGIAPFYRIKDTLENRDALRAAIAEYTEEQLLTVKELDKDIQEFRRKIKTTILPNLR